MTDTLFQCTICGRQSPVGRCCDENTRTPLNDAAREEVAREVARRLERPFNPDWSQLEAAHESLREHMAMVRTAQESEQRFRARVAAALEELRASWQSALDRYDSQICENSRDMLTFERWQELNERLKELDVVIAMVDKMLPRAATEEKK